MEFKLLLAGIVLTVLKIVLSRFMKKRDIKIKALNFIKEVCDTLGSALLAAAILMFFVIQAFKIPSGSMRNTFLEGDHLFVNKFIYGFHIPFSSKRVFPIKEVQRGDLIVFKAPNSALSPSEIEEGGKDFIKRCIALPGDTVEIKNKLLLVNGEIVNEEYAIHSDSALYGGAVLFNTQEEYQRAWEMGIFAGIPGHLIRDNFGPVTVPQGHYLMLGDNRDYSFDGRFFGPMPEGNIRGKALVRYWPLNRIKIF